MNISLNNGRRFNQNKTLVIVLICLTFSLDFTAILKYLQFMGTFTIQFLSIDNRFG